MILIKIDEILMKSPRVAEQAIILSEFAQFDPVVEVSKESA